MLHGISRNGGSVALDCGTFGMSVQTVQPRADRDVPSPSVHPDYLPNVRSQLLTEGAIVLDVDGRNHLSDNRCLANFKREHQTPLHWELRHQLEHSLTNKVVLFIGSRLDEDVYMCKLFECSDNEWELCFVLGLGQHIHLLEWETNMGKLQASLETLKQIITRTFFIDMVMGRLLSASLRRSLSPCAAVEKTFMARTGATSGALGATTAGFFREKIKYKIASAPNKK